MKKIVMVCCVSAILLLPAAANSQGSHSQSSAGYQKGRSQQPVCPSYDYRGHAQQNYQNARERYMANPTSQNYQIMQQREQIMHMREKQYREYGTGR